MGWRIWTVWGCYERLVLILRHSTNCAKILTNQPQSDGRQIALRGEDDYASSKEMKQKGVLEEKWERLWWSGGGFRQASLLCSLVRNQIGQMNLVRSVTVTRWCQIWHVCSQFSVLLLTPFVPPSSHSITLWCIGPFYLHYTIVSSSQKPTYYRLCWSQFSYSTFKTHDKGELIMLLQSMISSKYQEGSIKNGVMHIYMV